MRFEPTFAVVCQGQLVDGVEKALAFQRFGQLIKKPVDEVEALFNRGPVTIKSGLALDHAHQYQQKFRSLGLKTTAVAELKGELTAAFSQSNATSPVLDAPDFQFSHSPLKPVFFALPKVIDAKSCTSHTEIFNARSSSIIFNSKALLVMALLSSVVIQGYTTQWLSQHPIGISPLIMSLLIFALVIFALPILVKSPVQLTMTSAKQTDLLKESKQLWNPQRLFHFFDNNILSHQFSYSKPDDEYHCSTEQGIEFSAAASTKKPAADTLASDLLEDLADIDIIDNFRRLQSLIRGLRWLLQRSKKVDDISWPSTRRLQVFDQNNQAVAEIFFSNQKIGVKYAQPNTPAVLDAFILYLTMKVAI